MHSTSVTSPRISWWNSCKPYAHFSVLMYISQLSILNLINYCSKWATTNPFWCMVNGKVGLAGSFIRKSFSSSVKGTKDTWSAIIIFSMELDTKQLQSFFFLLEDIWSLDFSSCFIKSEMVIRYQEHVWANGFIVQFQIGIKCKNSFLLLSQ